MGKESESEVTQSCPTLGNPWTVTHQALLSMGFSRQEYWSGLQFPSPGKWKENETWERKESTKSRKQRVSDRINPRRNTLRHIVIKLTRVKGKDKIVKAKREKWQITYKRTPIRISADLSTETLQARRECHNIFKVMEGKNL